MNYKTKQLLSNFYPHFLTQMENRVAYKKMCTVLLGGWVVKLSEHR